MGGHLHLVEAPGVQPGERQAVLRGRDVPHCPAVRGVGDLLRDQGRRRKAGGQHRAQKRSLGVVDRVGLTFLLSAWEGDGFSPILQS